MVVGQPRTKAAAAGASLEASLVAGTLPGTVRPLVLKVGLALNKAAPHVVEALEETFGADAAAPAKFK